MFNSLLGKQVSLMVEHGALDINTASSTLKNFLRQDPEGAHLLEKLANTPDMSEVSPSSLATLVLDDTNGPKVNQWQIPNDQQHQFQHYQWSTTTVHLPCTNLGAPTVPPAANDQWFPYSDPACTNLGAPTVPPAANDQWFPYSDPACTNLGAPTVPPAANDQWFPYSDPACTNLGALTDAPAANDQRLTDSDNAYYDHVYSAVAPAATAQCPTSNDLAYTRALTVAKAPTAGFDHFTFTDEFGDDIENSVPNFQQMDPSTAEQLTQLEHLLDDQYGQYELPLELQTPEYEANNNGLQGVRPQQQRHRYHHEQETNQTQRDPLN
ncbi:unnamed protein product [Arabidopsis arenosa]|uniref:Uncharacterized protein n=1 Tax=Arabidopsis arenosa TaxID=38785 RepID=A0A8S2ALK7_ARAAE|nr:unnamed protein product [Arabidopsis arenosa]